MKKIQIVWKNEKLLDKNKTKNNMPIKPWQKR